MWNPPVIPADAYPSVWADINHPVVSMLFLWYKQERYQLAGTVLGGVGGETQGQSVKPEQKLLGTKAKLCLLIAVTFIFWTT